MKIKSLLLGMLTCFAVVACTNEDLGENQNSQESTGKADAYMAVKLMIADNNSSRATSDGGYNEGVDNEQWIKGGNSIFLFYDNEGKWVTSGELMDETNFADGDKGSHHAEGDINDLKGNAYVVLSSTTEGLKNKIAQVLTVVNYSDPASLKRLTKDEALREIASAESEKLTNGKQPTYGFLMSTSVYSNDEGEIINTTAINPESHIKATQQAAKDSPVEIYIERAAAKVQLAYTLGTQTTTIVKGGTEIPVIGDEDQSKGDEVGGQDGNDITIDGKQYPAYISIEGWTVNNVNDETRLVKKANGSWNETSPLLSGNWSNMADKRSYWAEGSKYNIPAEANNGLTAYSYNHAIAKNDNGNLTHLYTEAMYCYEQTIASPKYTTAMKGVDYPNVTTVLVAAKIKINDLAVGGVRDAGTLFKYGGVFYTETEYKKVIAKQIKEAGYMIYTDGTESAEAKYTSLTENNVKVISDGSLAGVKIEIINVDDKTIVTGVTKDENNSYTHTNSSKDAIEEFLNGKEGTETESGKPANQYVADVEGYKDGACYYQIPIEHLSSQEDANKTYLYGVVRNHWYKINISKIIRIGEAVFDPTELIPQIPAKDLNYYMAARLHILNWHVVNNNVTLD